MNKSQANQYLLAKPDARQDYPFGPDVAVFKIKGKMYATLSEHAGVPNMNLKCEPNQAQELRDLFDAVEPGYHMNKKHWNTLRLDGSIPAGEIERLIDHSYSLVVRGLRKRERDALLLCYGKEMIFRDE